MSERGSDQVRRLIGDYDAAQASAANERLAERISRCSRLMIFGAGQNGRLVLDALRDAGVTPAAFVDETPSKIGSSVDGVPVIGLDDASAIAGATVICSIFSPVCDYLSIAARLRPWCLETVPLFAFLRAFAAERSPFYFVGAATEVVANAAQFAWLADRLVNRASLDLLCAQIEFRLYLDHSSLPPWRPQRAPPPAAWSSCGVIDAGAFDGDTLLPLVAERAGQISLALALEPDPRNFAKLERNIAAAGAEVARKTRALQVAVDATSGRRAFSSFGNQGSGFTPAGDLVATASIDDLADAHFREERRLYIKFDVEGAEASAIEGAASTIVRRRPLLAVSAYHRPEDLWALPRQISALDDGYRYALLSHGADGADLMLYAHPPP